MAPTLGPRLLAVLITFRVLNALVVRTYFTPDEFWQGPEVAHYLAFGRGHLTWEWLPEARIRGFTHPLIFAGIFKLLSILGLDTNWAVAHSPKLVQGLLAGTGDYCTFGLALQALETEEGASWALLFQLASWFNFYCLVRPYSNSAEACLATAALYFWCPFVLVGSDSSSLKASGQGRGGGEGQVQIEHGKEGAGGGQGDGVRVVGAGGSPARERFALLLGALCVAVRPTSAAHWAAVGLFRLLDMSPRRWPAYLTTVVFPPVVLVVGASFLLDSWLYGTWTLVPERFLRFNVVEGGSRIFGEQAWHWNFTQGLPAVLGAALPLAVRGGLQALGSGPGGMGARRLSWLILWFLATHSLTPHKELRFLLPIVPLSHILAGGATRTIIIYWRGSGQGKRCNRSTGEATPNVPGGGGADAPRRGLGSLGGCLPMVIVAGILVIHVPAALYLSTIHQRGPLAAVEAVARLLPAAVAAGGIGVGTEGTGFSRSPGRVGMRGTGGEGGRGMGAGVSVHFLMPCHSTPLHSHLHFQEINPSLWSLDCSPANRLRPRGSESDQFQRDPLAFVKALYLGSPALAPAEGVEAETFLDPVKGRKDGPLHISPRPAPDVAVVYDTHLPLIEATLSSVGMEVEECLFNAHVNGDMDSNDTHRSVCVLLRRQKMGEGAL
ncbi:unnamed protein product, partial [Discosporangium mesarthrocarpum]